MQRFLRLLNDGKLYEPCLPFLLAEEVCLDSTPAALSNEDDSFDPEPLLLCFLWITEPPFFPRLSQKALCEGLCFVLLGLND